MLSVGSLFSGIGGLEKGLERTGGFETVWQCEIDPYCSEVLKKQWPGVPNLGDITKVRWEDVRRPDVICGGFPCQDISVAGKGRGIKKGTRSGLWSEFAKAIGILRPRYAVVENVPMLANRGLNIVLADLAEMGYDAEWGLLSARAVGANHKRERLFIIAYPRSSNSADCNRKRCDSWSCNDKQLRDFQRRGEMVPQEDNDGRGVYAACSGVEVNVSDSERERCGRGDAAVGKAEDAREIQGRGSPVVLANANFKRVQRLWQEEIPRFEEFSWCQNVRRVEDLCGRLDIPEPLVRGSGDGLSRRLDSYIRRERTKACGNAVVPQVAQVIGQWILGFNLQ